MRLPSYCVALHTVSTHTRSACISFNYVLDDIKVYLSIYHKYTMVMAVNSFVYASQS